MTKSKTTSKTRQKFDFGMEPKWQHVFHMLLDHCYAFGLLLYPSGLKKNFLKERDPWPIFAPPWICPWADLVEKQQHLQVTMSTSSPPSFIKIHQAVLEKKLQMWKFTDVGRRRRTTDGALWQLRLRWAKNFREELKKNGNMTKSITPNGHRVIRGLCDLLYDPQGHDTICCQFDLVYEPKRSRGH